MKKIFKILLFLFFTSSISSFASSQDSKDFILVCNGTIKEKAYSHTGRELAPRNEKLTDEFKITAYKKNKSLYSINLINSDNFFNRLPTTGGFGLKNTNETNKGFYKNRNFKSFQQSFNNNIYLTFPFNKMNGGNISLIVLAAREVANVLEEKKGSSDNYIDTLNPKPTSMPKNIGNILDNVALVCMDMDNLKKTTNIAALNVRVSRTKNIHSNIFEKDIFNNSEDHKIKGKSNSLGTANLGIPETAPCMFYPIPLLHPTIKFKLLIASGEINEALKHVDKIHPSLHDHLSIFLCGHGYYKEAINKIPGLTKAGMLECILNNKTELKTELPRLIEYSVFHENWMIQHIAIGLAEEKNVESLEKFLELCMKNKLWDQATFISSFLPLHLQMKTAGIIARQERKRIKDLKGNMDGIEAMAKVTTIAKYRPKFSSSSNKNANSKYKKIWSKMPSTESLRRAWNEELDKNFYMKDNIKISRTLSVKKD